MAKQTVPDLKELFRQAAEVARQVPEGMQEAAFNRALDLLIGEPTNATTAATSRSKPAARSSSEIQPTDARSRGFLLEHIDSTRHPGVRAAKKALDRSLMVLQIALRDHSVDGLNPAEIARILTDKFRLRTTRQAVGMALKDASDFVDRVSEGGAYRYRIMGPGEEYLAHIERADGVRPGTAATRTTARPQHHQVRTTESSKSATKRGVSVDGRQNKATKKQTSRKVGPKAAIVSLVDSGFFATPKTGPEVQTHLKTRRGFDLGTDQIRLAMLRLVRDGALERDENKEGQYEYKRP